MPLPYLASTSDIKGALAPTKQPSRRRYIKGKGATTVEVWHGPTEDGIVGKYADLIAAGYTNVETSGVGNGIWQVEGSIEGDGEGSPELPVNQWQLLSSAEQVDILTHRKVVALNDEELKAVLEGVNNPKPGVSPALTLANAIELYMLMMRGVKTYPRAQHILRHSLSVPNDDAISTSAAMGGDFRIWDGGDLPDMPAGFSAAISAIGQPSSLDTEGVDGDSFMWGWLKQPTTIATDIYGRTQIDREWWLANWPLFVYDPYTP